MKSIVRISPASSETSDDLIRGRKVMNLVAVICRDSADVPTAVSFHFIQVNPIIWLSALTRSAMLMLTIAAKSIPQGVGMLIKFGTIVQEQSTQRALSWSALRSGSDIPELRGVFLRKDFQ